jgi:hypothetical protein
MEVIGVYKKVCFIDWLDNLLEHFLRLAADTHLDLDFQPISETLQTSCFCGSNTWV